MTVRHKPVVQSGYRIYPAETLLSHSYLWTEGCVAMEMLKWSSITYINSVHRRCFPVSADEEKLSWKNSDGMTITWSMRKTPVKWLFWIRCVVASVWRTRPRDVSVLVRDQKTRWIYTSHHDLKHEGTEEGCKHASHVHITERYIIKHETHLWFCFMVFVCSERFSENVRIEVFLERNTSFSFSRK